MLTSNKIATAVRIGYKMTVALAEETAVEVPVKLTTQTITNSKTKMNSLGVCDRRNPWNIKAAAKNTPFTVYAAGALFS